MPAQLTAAGKSVSPVGWKEWAFYVPKKRPWLHMSPQNWEAAWSMNFSADHMKDLVAELRSKRPHRDVRLPPVQHQLAEPSHGLWLSRQGDVGSVREVATSDLSTTWSSRLVNGPSTASIHDI
eukprot:gb/GECG01001361.1/.p1 GENE.gb/GECG01001361.1/~~gb/GECG01001361.1/.p1  ORF type:complete len:123 (+),score=8.48 gb/GECG01001361.1/:1-369(+)